MRLGLVICQFINEIIIRESFIRSNKNEITPCFPLIIRESFIRSNKNEITPCFPLEVAFRDVK